MSDNTQDVINRATELERQLYNRDDVPREAILELIRDIMDELTSVSTQAEDLEDLEEELGRVEGVAESLEEERDRLSDRVFDLEEEVRMVGGVLTTTEEERDRLSDRVYDLVDELAELRAKHEEDGEGL